MKIVALVILVAAAAAGCGGGNGKTQQGATAQPTATAGPPAATSPQPTATTNTPPKKHRKKPQPLGGSSTQPLQVTAPYKCHGKPLRALSSAGPVKVSPAIVKPGQSFTVTVLDPSVKVALVSLAGVAPQPIQANARPHGAHVAARLRMPSYATCGNKLLEVEGDLSAEAYVAVARR